MIIILFKIFYYTNYIFNNTKDMSGSIEYAEMYAKLDPYDKRRHCNDVSKRCKIAQGAPGYVPWPKADAARAEAVVARLRADYQQLFEDFKTTPSHDRVHSLGDRMQLLDAIIELVQIYCTYQSPFFWRIPEVCEALAIIKDRE